MTEDTSRRRLSGGALDRAIDRAVHDMMNVEPPPWVRRRVLLRLEAPARRSMLFPRIAVAAGALAVVLIAVLLLRPAPAPVPAPDHQVATVPPGAATAPDVTAPPRPVASQATPAPAQPTRPAMTATLIRTPAISNIFEAGSGRISAAAADIEDVVFPPLTAAPAREDALWRPGAISIPQITVPPLQVQQLRVDPLATRR